MHAPPHQPHPGPHAPTHASAPQRAAKASREVGVATFILAALIGLPALLGLALGLGSKGPELDTLLRGLGLLGVAGGLAYLGWTMRQRQLWSFRVSAGLFAALAVAGAVMALLHEGRSSPLVIAVFSVGLPLAFVAAAERARRAVLEARTTEHPHNAPV